MNGCKAGAEGSGTLACYKAGYGRVGIDGYIESVVDSCHGQSSCSWIAYTDSGNGGTVGSIKNSCHGTQSCADIAYSNSGDGGTVGSIKDSCHGQSSCESMSGSYSGIVTSVGDITCSCQGESSCYRLYSGYWRNGHALSIDELSFCCHGADDCSEENGIITLPETCAAGNYSTAGDSTCSVPTFTPSLSPSQSPSKVPTGSPSKQVSFCCVYKMYCCCTVMCRVSLLT